MKSSAPASPCAAPACGNSSTASSTSPRRTSATSAESPSKSFDGRGNYACGIQEQSIFPEIEIDQIKRQIGFDLIFVTSAPTDAEGRALLSELGMPFRDMKKATEETAEAAAV